MHRREALVATAGTAGLLMFAQNASPAAEPASIVPDAIRVAIGKPFQIGMQSTPVNDDGAMLHIIGLGRGVLELNREMRLTAKIHAGVAEYAAIDYWLSLAVFEAQGQFLGAATQKVEVQYIRLGQMPTTARQLDFDFGISKSFGKVALLVAAISDRDVAKPA